MRAIYGALSFDKILWIFIPFMILSPIYTYYMAVSKGEEPPYPFTTVTKTVCHYPQDIEFRWGMMIAASFMSLLFFVMFRWLSKQALKYDFQPMSKIHFYLMEGSVFCFCIMIGTMDGMGVGLWHFVCSIIFFVNLTVHVIIITFYLVRLHNWSSESISSKSLLFKKLLSLYIIIIWSYCIYKIWFPPNQYTIDNKFIDIIQWNTVFISLVWMLSFYPEWKDVHVTLSSN